jgi:ATP-binding cassette, subfamily A (ABC1), member 3
MLQEIRKVYDSGKQAVRGVSFGVPLGQCFGFLGINGAGKTTTLKILSGEILPTTGTATVDGLDVLTQQRAVRKRIGYESGPFQRLCWFVCVSCVPCTTAACMICSYCPQFDALFELLTVREHLELFCRIKCVKEAEIAPNCDDLVALMDLTKFRHKRAGTLSGGNRRKLSLALALIGEPPLLFLGEIMKFS